LGASNENRRGHDGVDVGDEGWVSELVYLCCNNIAID
jgi:hypothetical protein